MGALVGLIFPPALIGSAAVGAAAGAFGGHLSKGMSRSDMKDLGDLLEAGEAGLVVIGDWRLEERIDELMAGRATRGQGAARPRPGRDREADLGGEGPRPLEPRALLDREGAPDPVAGAPLARGRE